MLAHYSGHSILNTNHNHVRTVRKKHISHLTTDRNLFRQVLNKIVSIKNQNKSLSQVRCQMPLSELCLSFDISEEHALTRTQNLFNLFLLGGGGRWGQGQHFPSAIISRILYCWRTISRSRPLQLFWERLLKRLKLWTETKGLVISIGEKLSLKTETAFTICIQYAFWCGYVRVLRGRLSNT